MFHVWGCGKKGVRPVLLLVLTHFFCSAWEKVGEELPTEDVITRSLQGFEWSFHSSFPSHQFWKITMNFQCWQMSEQEQGTSVAYQADFAQTFKPVRQGIFFVGSFIFKGMRTNAKRQLSQKYIGVSRLWALIGERRFYWWNAWAKPFLVLWNFLPLQFKMANDKTKQKNPTTELSEGLYHASVLEWVRAMSCPIALLSFLAESPAIALRLCWCAADSEFEVSFPHLSAVMTHAEMQAGCKMAWSLKCNNNNKSTQNKATL